MYVCARCKNEKEESEFPKDKYKKRGFGYRCKECERKRLYDARREKPEIWEQQKYKNMIENRIKKGIPIDIPKMRIVKPIGTGYIKRGYRNIYLPNDKYTTRKDGVVLEHVLVMCRNLGRLLEKHETVHHINGIKDDNRLENLELCSHSHPHGQRIEDKIAWCKEFLEIYGYKIE